MADPWSTHKEKNDNVYVSLQYAGHFFRIEPIIQHKALQKKLCGFDTDWVTYIDGKVSLPLSSDLKRAKKKCIRLIPNMIKRDHEEHTAYQKRLKAVQDIFNHRKKLAKKEAIRLKKKTLFINKKRTSRELSMLSREVKNKIEKQTEAYRNRLLGYAVLKAKK